MDIFPRRFLTTWAVGVTSALAVLVAFNMAVDPYLMFNTSRIPGFNAHKATAIDAQELMIKAYNAPRAAARTVVLGSSIVDFGLDTRDPTWPARARPVYNLGFIGGGGPRLAYLYLQHVLSHQDLDMVVLGLDFQTFLTTWSKNPDFLNPAVEARLITDRNGSATRTRQRVLDTLQASISLDVTLDSISTVAASMNDDTANFVGGNAPVLPLTNVPASDLFTIMSNQKAQVDSTVMPFVRAVLELCKRRRINVIVLINPTHADALEIFDRLGFWEAFEDWKRELVTLTSEYNQPADRLKVNLWDFSGYYTHTMGIAKLGSPTEADRFWFDNLHYTKALGTLILRRIFTKEDMDFGVLLDRVNVEAHMRKIRQQQRRYRETFPADARRVLEIYQDAGHFHWN